MVIKTTYVNESGIEVSKSCDEYCDKCLYHFSLKSACYCNSLKNHKTWKLFLDDQHNENLPERVRCPADFLPAKNIGETKKLIENNGPPIEMWLDFDLGINEKGERETALDFVKWLASQTSKVPTYKIITKNPIGRQQLESYLNSWSRSLE